MPKTACMNDNMCSDAFAVNICPYYSSMLTAIFVAFAVQQQLQLGILTRKTTAAW